MPRSVLVLLVLASPAQGASPQEVTLVLCDGSILKGVTLPAAVEVATRYGRLVVPSKDIRRIQIGLRLGRLPWLGVWGQDTITTDDSVLTGRLAGAVFKGRSKTLGEVRVRVANLRSVSGNEDKADEAAAERAQQAGLEEILSLARRGVSDDLIIQRIYAPRVVYRLSPDQIRSLRENGLSDKVVTAINATATGGVVSSPALPQ